MKRVLSVFALIFLALILNSGVQAVSPGTLRMPSIPNSPTTAYMPLIPVYTDALVLVANTKQTQAVPAGSTFVIFSGACNFFAISGDTLAAVPAASTTNGGAPMQNPSGWAIPPGTASISLIAASACIVTLSFYTN